MTNSDDRLFAMLIYLVSFFFPILGPLIIWLLKRDESEFVDYHGKEYLNFFLSFTIYSIISGILVLILIGFVLLFVIGILAFIFTIIALIKAYQGERYRIPLVIRMIK
ncbi:DUF4870 domain-containing protein [Ornithinibacillus sp. L9]|uniref:DUF4870 domain-containing protein n=1 Tax=Ornithinibacillus caprae TaxID=2678566 RepID=A0A6N8FER5_9BACI|nr:DUF4870 domain-containing protein [Ornithinibacillus caprae]MUK88013.1 DUF4870 domain-containing protein [Ornithinibacillus caprae]